MTALANTQEGTCYILGNSSSLTALDLTALAASGQKLLGINRILQVVTTHWLIVSDSEVLVEETTRLQQEKPTLLLLHKLEGLRGERIPEVEAWHWDVTPIPYQHGGRPSAQDLEGWRKMGVFLRSGNTGTYAIEAAAIMGFTEIRLLGMDLRFDLAKTHFYGVNKYHGQRRQYTPKHIQGWAECFGLIADDLKDRGIDVVNETHIEGPLDDYLPREKPRWLKKK